MSHYFENDMNLKSEIKELSYKYNSSFFMFYSDNGVFSKRGIDYGSKLLLETYLRENITNKKVLDVGCGYGFIGIVVSLLTDSYVDMIEEEYKQNTILIEYFIEIIRMIAELINEDNKKINNKNINQGNVNDNLINEVLQRINDLMEDYKYRYEDEQNNRLYPLLYDTLQKIKNLKFDNENNYNMDFSSNRLKLLINSNPNITNSNYPNYINNSGMNDSNYILNNNNNLFSNRTNNNTILNNNQINSSRQIQMNNSSSYINPLTQRNNYYMNQNLTLNPSSPRNNNIFPIKEDIESNLLSTDFNYINIPQLPNEILNNLNSENIQNYKLVINFLINEYKQISEEQNNYFNRNNYRKKYKYYYR